MPPGFKIIRIPISANQFASFYNRTLFMKKEEIVMTEYFIFNFIHILFYSNFITDLNIDRLL